MNIKNIIMIIVMMLSMISMISLVSAFHFGSTDFMEYQRFNVQPAGWLAGSACAGVNISLANPTNPLEGNASAHVFNTASIKCSAPKVWANASQWSIISLVNVQTGGSNGFYLSYDYGVGGAILTGTNINCGNSGKTATAITTGKNYTIQVWYNNTDTYGVNVYNESADKPGFALVGSCNDSQDVVNNQIGILEYNGQATFDYFCTFNSTTLTPQIGLDCLGVISDISNSTFNVTNYPDLISNSTAWNSNGYINLSKNLLSFTFNTNTDVNASCSIHNLNYTQMTALNPNYKLATTMTTSHAYTLYNNLSAYNASTCVYCAYYDGSRSASSGCLKTMFSDIRPPSINRTSQVPPDLTIINLMAQVFKVSFDIIDDSQITKAILNLKANYSDSDYGVCTLGLCTNTFAQINYSILSGNNYTFISDDNNIIPAIYNLDEEYMEDTAHSMLSTGSVVKIRFEDVSTAHPFGFVEAMTNLSVASSSVYYCNSSYVSGNIGATPNCASFFTIPAKLPFNHTHPGNFSSHILIPFPVTGGHISGVQVTNVSYIVFNPLISQNYFYLPNNTGTVQTSGSVGAVWSSFSGTIDSHIHQFDSNTTLYYCLNASDIWNNYNVSCYSDRFDITYFPPTSPDVYLPSGAYNQTLINISYTNSSVFNPLDTRLIYYQIDLTDNVSTFISQIYNNSLNLTYLWDTTSIADGYYRIRVTVTDNNSMSSQGFSDIFLLDKTSPICSDLAITGTGQGSTQLVTATATDNILLDWVNLSIDGTSQNGIYNVSSLAIAYPYVITQPTNTTVGMNLTLSDRAGNTDFCQNTFVVTSVTPENEILSFGTCPSGLENVFLLMFIYAIAIVLLLIGGILGSEGLGVFGGLLWILASMIFSNCNILIGIVLLFLGLIITLFMILRWMYGKR